MLSIIDFIDCPGRNWSINLNSQKESQWGFSFLDFATYFKKNNERNEETKIYLKRSGTIYIISILRKIVKPGRQKDNHITCT